MDAGEYATNTLLIKNISAIAYRIYEPVVQQSSTYTFAVSDVETALRSHGHLVYADSIRRGLWCFHFVGKDGASIGQPTKSVLGTTVDICGYTLGLVEDGAFEPASLLRNRPIVPGVANTPNSSTPGGAGWESTLRNAQSAQPSSTPPTEHETFDFEARPINTAISEAKGYGLIPVKEAYDYLISAVLSSLSFGFCSNSGAVALNRKSFLLPPLDGQDDVDDAAMTSARLPTLVTFRVYLTTTGTLVISLRHTCVHGLFSSTARNRTGDLAPGSVVLAAPLGLFATFQGRALDDGSTADARMALSPDTQISRLRPEMDDRLVHWRKACTKMLTIRGISSSILQNSPWLNIQSLRKRPLESRTDGKRTPVVAASTLIPWPAVLCFWKAGAPTAIGKCQWSFDKEDHDFDPLSSAKTWLLGQPQRDEALNKRSKDREGNVSREAASEIGNQHLTAPEYSPLALRGPTHGGTAANQATGAMYPTPPDGVQGAIGVTPSFEGAVSSPAQPATIGPAGDGDTTMTNAAPPPDLFGTSWDNLNMDLKRERQGQSSIGEPDTLFGDVGGDLFADNDITDADFNFFDEQPEGSMLGFNGVADFGASMEAIGSERATLAVDQITRQTHSPQDKKPSPPRSPVFAKPELKHARSSLGDSARQPGQIKTLPQTVAAGIKRQPSPFNPETVYKRVKASMGELGATVGSVTAVPSVRRRSSIFEKVDFDPFLAVNNMKYQENGRFDIHWQDQKENTPVSPSKGAPTTDYLQRHGRGKAGLKSLASNMNAIIATLAGNFRDSSLQHSPVRENGTASDADDLSLISDQDDDSSGPDEPTSPTKSLGFRRRAEDDTVSVAASVKELEGIAALSPLVPVDMSRFPNSEMSEFSISKYFADTEPLSADHSLADGDFVMVAQILTEQAIMGTLHTAAADEALLENRAKEVRRHLANQMRDSVGIVRSALSPSLAAATEAHFKPFIEVQDMPLLGQPSRMQPRPPGGPDQQRPLFFNIPSPRVEVRRNDVSLSVVPSAIGFWEVLGLAPSKGSKELVCLCVFPDHDGMADAANSFLDRMRILYESMKLGTFERVPDASGGIGGLLPCEPNEIPSSPISGFMGNGYASWEQLNRLANTLAARKVSDKNFVIFWVYSREIPSSIVDACAGFQRLFELYKKSLLDRRSQCNNDLVLQLVPLDFLSAPSSLVFPQAADYIKFCMEIYDRSTLFGGPMPSPAVLLEPSLPRLIDFKLTTAPSANLLHENTCMHIAYAQSIDERWVTAAWTDNRGSKQMTASYCLGRKGKALSTPLADVVREIWDTTHDLISQWKVHWRVVVTKCSPMDPEEMEVWIELGKNETQANITLTLLTVDTNPSMQLIPPTVKIPVPTTSASYTTPVSTPQPSIASPEQTGNPSTPIGTSTVTHPTTPGGDNAAETELEGTVVDITDTTWGAVLSHRLSNSASLTDLSPALASGYLIKRGGTDAEDPPVVMEVNVVHSEGNPRAYENLLREMLTYFRALGTLARAREVVDRETDVRPWHVAAAEKGAKILYQLM